MNLIHIQGRYWTLYFVIVPRTHLMNAPVQPPSVAQEDSQQLALLSFVKSDSPSLRVRMERAFGWWQL